MDRFVVLVDAGYLLSQAVTMLSGKQSRKRGDLHIQDPSGLVAHLVAETRRVLDIPPHRELLRVYWYDGVMPSGLSKEQKELMRIDDVLFRAGTVNGQGQQKGVDSLIVTDLIELAANHAIADAMLVTGDSDLAVGIDLAQRKGVRIAVLGVHDANQGVNPHQSFEITSRADRKTSLGLIEAQRFFSYQPLTTNSAPPSAPHRGAPRPHTVAGAPLTVVPPPTSAPAVSTPNALKNVGVGQNVKNAPAVDNTPAQLTSQRSHAITAAVRAFIAENDKAQLASVGNGQIPRELDGSLLYHVYIALGKIRLTESERKATREIFRTELATSSDEQSDPCQGESNHEP